MEVTEVRVKLVDNDDDRLKAFCSITLDDEFVVRDIKVIGGEGRYFVAMPSRKMSDHCPKCRGKNHLRARYCNYCGKPLPGNRVQKDPSGRMKLHADIAHPINTQCRCHIQKAVVEKFEEEIKRSKLPGYKPVEMDVDDDCDFAP